MFFSQWKIWAKGILWFHIATVILSSIFCAFVHVVNNQSVALHALLYTFLLLAILSLCPFGTLFGDIFGHRDIRGILVSQGMWGLGLIGILIPLGMFSAMDTVILYPGASVWEFFPMMQRYGVWISFVLTVIYACIFLLIHFLGKGIAQIPKSWSMLTLALAVLFFLTAFNGFYVGGHLAFFMTLFVLSLLVYVIWIVWLALFVEKLERMH
jgi:hypothetical protein